MADAVENELRIEWSSKHWSLLAASVIGVTLALLGGAVMVFGDGVFVRGLALGFALCGAAWVYFSVREYFWERTYFLHADANEVRWGHSRAAPTVVRLAQLKRAVLHFESDSQGFSLETLDGLEQRWALLKRERLQALHEHLTRACSAEIVKD